MNGFTESTDGLYDELLKAKYQDILKPASKTSSSTVTDNWSSSGMLNLSPWQENVTSATKSNTSSFFKSTWSSDSAPHSKKPTPEKVRRKRKTKRESPTFPEFSPRQCPKKQKHKKVSRLPPQLSVNDTFYSHILNTTNKTPTTLPDATSNWSLSLPDMTSTSYASADPSISPWLESPTSSTVSSMIPISPQPAPHSKKQKKVPKKTPTTDVYDAISNWSSASPNLTSSSMGTSAHASRYPWLVESPTHTTVSNTKSSELGCAPCSMKWEQEQVSTLLNQTSINDKFYSDVLKPVNKTSTTVPDATSNWSSPFDWLDLKSTSYASGHPLISPWLESPTSTAVSNTIPAQLNFGQPKSSARQSSFAATSADLPLNQTPVKPAQTPLNLTQPISSISDDPFKATTTNLPLNLTSVKPAPVPLNSTQPISSTLSLHLTSIKPAQAPPLNLTNLPVSHYPSANAETVTLPGQTNSTSDQSKNAWSQLSASEFEMKPTCSDDVVFVGEFKKPELNDASSDIVFVRKSFKRSGVVCLTPNRKLRRQKSAPNRISVYDDSTEFKVTISRKKSSSMATLPSNEWSYETELGLKMFDPNTTSLLEHLYMNCSDSDSTIMVTLPGTGDSYNINMKKLTMRNVSSGKEVFLVRIPSEPEQIDAAPSSSCLGDFPSYWSPQVNEIELVEITPSFHVNEWTKIERKLKKTMGNIFIEKIERVQNKKLWIRYAFQKAMLIDKNGIVNEKLLFHGTRENPPWKIYQSEDGFDMRFSRNGAWGCGTYFAKKAAYSNDYAYISYTDSSVFRQMFTASVLTGNSIELKPNNTLRRPPVYIQATATKPEVLYDSVTGLTCGSVSTRIYVLYKFDMAYPSYLVTYIPL